jgi:RHS repeat-associated protein
MVRSGVTYRLITDHQDTVLAVVNVATGEIEQQIDYDAWGRVLLDTNPGLQPFRFAGGIYDVDTGLVRFGSRDYDARLGRWTTKPSVPMSAETVPPRYLCTEWRRMVPSSCLRPPQCQRAVSSLPRASTGGMSRS